MIYLTETTKFGKENVTFEHFPSEIFSNVFSLKSTSKTFYQVGVVANQSFNLQYSCVMCNHSTCWPYSDKVNISVIPKVVEPIFAPKIESGFFTPIIDTPFPLSCSLINSFFSPQNKSYLVVFYNSRDSLLARYEVDGKKV